MQAAHDPGTLQGLLVTVFGLDSHESGHFVLGDGDFSVPPRRQGDVLYAIVHVGSFNCVIIHQCSLPVKIDKTQ